MQKADTSNRERYHAWACVRMTGLALASIGLTACSGGGGGSSTGPVPPVPAPVNANPVFTSPATANVEENSNTIVYTATAQDEDGDALSFAISGGVDAAAFDLDPASGGLSFLSPPDFEAPGDSDGDNVYEVEIEVRDGRGGSATLSLVLTVTDSVEPPSGTRYKDRVFESTKVTRDVVLATAPIGGETQTLLMDIFEPEADTVRDRPVILFYSGGSFLAQNRRGIEGLAVDFAQRGYVAVTADYRVLENTPVTADELAIGGLRALHDVFAAVRFFRADANDANLYGVRGDAVFIGGSSAGGILAASAATLDPADSIASSAIQGFLDGNGGVYGTVGDHISESSNIQGALSLAGAILYLSSVGSDSAPTYAAHFELDPGVPCYTAEEGSTLTGLVISGTCEFIPAMQAAGVRSEAFLVPSTVGHTGFSDAQREVIYNGAAALFYDAVISSQPE